jgi:very-short-patch-repair endonuclease
VVSLRQLLALGLSRSAVEGRVRGKRLLPLHRGVYAVGHRALTWRGRLIAAVYACGPGALASHRAAGALHGIVNSGRIEVTVPRSCGAHPGITVHRTRSLDDPDRTFIAAVPVTTVARTLVDLADTESEERLAKAVHEAEILRVFDLRALEQAQARAGTRTGRGRLTRVLAAYQPEPHFLRSRAERRVKDLCAEAGLPKPQFNISLGGYELDVYWPEARLALEIDGAETHATTYAFHSDRRRDRALAAQGIQVNRVTWPDLNADLTRQLREILARR